MTTSQPNHIRFLLVGAKKNAKWKTGFSVNSSDVGPVHIKTLASGKMAKGCFNTRRNVEVLRGAQNATLNCLHWQSERCKGRAVQIVLLRTAERRTVVPLHKT